MSFGKKAANVFACLLIVFLLIYSLLARPGVSSNPPGQALGTTLSTIILNYNNSQDYWVDGASQWTVPVKGVTVNKIYAPQALAEAAALDASVGDSAPMSIPLALLASESIMDPLCQNGNLLGSNPNNDPWGYDDGVAQLKLKYISIGGKSFPTPALAQAFAFNPSVAIPYFWGLYQSHLETADQWIGGNTNSLIDPRLLNRYILAAIIYKQGAAGAYTIFKAGVWPSELDNFQSLQQYFATKLGEKPLTPLLLITTTPIPTSTRL